MGNLQTTVSTYTTTQRATKIYQTVVDVFDWDRSSDCVTPFELALKQLEGVDPEGTLCIPGAGIGTYVLAAMQRGVQPENIYAVELDAKYYELGSAMFERFGVNYVLADFLEWNPQMKFDAVIGNPPYQDSSTESHDKKLWTQFVFNSIELVCDGGIVSFVTPNSLVGRTRVPAQTRKLLSTVCSLDWIDHNTNAFFPNVGVDVCSWSVTKRNYTGETLVKDELGSRVIDIRKELPVPSALKFSDDLAEKIRAGISGVGVPELKREYNDVDQEPATDGMYVNYYAGRNKSFRTNTVCKNTGKLKVVFSFSATYKQWFVTDANVSGSNLYVCVDTVEQGLEIGHTLMHPILMFYIDNWRRTAGFCPAIKNNGALPDIRGLTDAEIVKGFNLTDEEVSYIMDSHKPYRTIERVLLQ